MMSLRDALEQALKPPPPVPKQKLEDWLAEVAVAFVTDPKWKEPLEEYRKRLSRGQTSTYIDMFFLPGSALCSGYKDDFKMPDGWSMGEFAAAVKQKSYTHKIKAPDHELHNYTIRLEPLWTSVDLQHLVASIFLDEYRAKVVGIKVVVIVK
jgi:hypothetical protein